MAIAERGVPLLDSADSLPIHADQLIGHHQACTLGRAMPEDPLDTQPSTMAAQRQAGPGMLSFFLHKGQANIR
jgi:hypothetical protein